MNETLTWERRRCRHARFTSVIGLALCSLIISMGVAAPATADTVVYTDSFGQVVNSQVSIGGTSYSADWFLPNGTASALMILGHGFSRGCSNVRNSGINIMHEGIMLLCVNASMQNGNPSLGTALGNFLADRSFTPPGGAAVPLNYIVSGHSAGGHFATEVGRRLNERNYTNFKGAILFDPVSSSGFSENLTAISANGTRAVYAVTANSSSCNSFNNSYSALRAMVNPFVGLQLTNSSTHVDIEDGNSDTVMQLLCGFIQSSNVTYVQTLSAIWANDLATGALSADYYPGGSYINSLIAQNRATLLKSCGSASLDSGEQCDLGLQNGQAGSCCSATCSFVSAGTTCRAVAGACDVAESCSGSSASCPNDINPACTPTNTATKSPTPTETATATQTATPTQTASETATLTATATASETATYTASASATVTPTATGTASHTPTHSPTSTASQTSTATATSTTPSPTATVTPTSTATVMPSSTATVTMTASATPSDTPIPTGTPTATETPLGICPIAAQESCKSAAAGRGSLSLSRKLDDPGKNKAQWKWKRGAATDISELGDPTTGTSYRLCIYDGSEALQMSLFVPAGGNWIRKGSGFAYSDASAAADGIRKLSLKAGGAGAAQVILKGQGVHLPMVNLPLAQDPSPIVAQLINSSTTACFEARYSAPPGTSGSTTKWKDKND